MDEPKKFTIMLDIAEVAAAPDPLVAPAIAMGSWAGEDVTVVLASEERRVYVTCAKKTVALDLDDVVVRALISMHPDRAMKLVPPPPAAETPTAAPAPEAKHDGK